MTLQTFTCRSRGLKAISPNKNDREEPWEPNSRLHAETENKNSYPEWKFSRKTTSLSSERRDPLNLLPHPVFCNSGQVPGRRQNLLLPPKADAYAVQSASVHPPPTGPSTQQDEPKPTHASVTLSPAFDTFHTSGKRNPSSAALVHEKIEFFHRVVQLTMQTHLSSHKQKHPNALRRRRQKFQGVF